MNSISRSAKLALIICFSALALTANSAQAIVELKAAYSVLEANPSSANAYADALTLPEIGAMSGFSADALVSLPTMPIGLGLRYETFSQTGSTSTYSTKSNYQRVSVIVDKRFVDTLAYVGILATFGVTNDFKLAATPTGGTESDLKANGGFSASAGLEAGLKLGILIVGGEVGYMYAPIGDLKDSSGNAVQNNGANVKMDLSGLYARATVGIGF